MKKIVIESCLECPMVNDCKVWKKLTAKQRFIITCSVEVKVGILIGCPLEDN